MDHRNLYSDLLKAYSDKNLNRITGKLIDIYRAKDFTTLREIAAKISRHLPLETDNDVKSFSKIIMLYHPDKAEFYRKQIDVVYKKKDFEKLVAFSHILELDGIENIKVAEVKKREPVEDESDYVWEDTADGFEYYDDYESAAGDEFDDYNENYDSYEDEENEYVDDRIDYKQGLSFYDAVKMREYGKLDIEFPPYYLEDFEEINFAESDISSLYGIEYCKHAVNLNLSGNNISDLSGLAGLSGIKELFLADNDISYIDALSSLLNLETLDLSNNDIDDIAPLFNLLKLQYVNLVGNRIPADQADIIRKKSIIVLT